MTSPIVPKEDVRNALHGIFVEEKREEARTKGEMSKILTRHQMRPDLSLLIEEHGLAKVNKLAHKLFKNNLLYSTQGDSLQVIATEPQDPGPSISPLPVISDPSKTTQAQISPGNATTTNDDTPACSPANEQKKPSADKSKHQKRPLSASQSSQMSGLPYDLQHRLLSEMQHVLEVACFEFALNNHPEVLKPEWDCPEAVELNLIIKVLGPLAVQGPVLRSNDVLVTSVCDIRHAAVHRERVTIGSLEQMFEHGEKLLSLFGDVERRRMIETLHQGIGPLATKLVEEEDQVNAASTAERQEIVQRKKREMKIEEAYSIKVAEEHKKILRNAAGAEMTQILTSSGINTTTGRLGKYDTRGVTTPNPAWLVASSLSTAVMKTGTILAFFIITTLSHVYEPIFRTFRTPVKD